MNEQDKNDTLIRIDERTGHIKETLERGDARMATIEKKLASLPCQTQGQKIKTLEKVTWAVALSFMAKTAWGWFGK